MCVSLLCACVWWCAGVFAVPFLGKLRESKRENIIFLALESLHLLINPSENKIENSLIMLVYKYCPCPPRSVSRLTCDRPSVYSTGAGPSAGGVGRRFLYLLF